MDSNEIDQLLKEAAEKTGETEIQLAAHAYLYALQPFVTSLSVDDEYVNLGVHPSVIDVANETLEDMYDRFGEQEFMNEVNTTLLDAYAFFLFTKSFEI